MGTYLSDQQIERIRRELTIVFSLPYATDLFGTAWEQILADAKAGVWTGKRDNRPNPDIYVPLPGGTRKNFSVKCEHLKARPGRRVGKVNGPSRADAAGFRGDKMDFIIARPKADELLGGGETVANLDATALGSLVLRYYNEQIVQRYEWHALSFVAPVVFTEEPDRIEFVYWEEEPPTIYNTADYWWQDTGRATGSNRNIAGYPHTVARGTQPLPAAKFRWTSGGKQFYVLDDIPPNADVWTVTKVKLTRDDIWEALQRKLAAAKRITSQPPQT